jgi:hypothetical protein
MERYCRRCRDVPAQWKISHLRENSPLCEPCADRMASCPHTSWFRVPVHRDDGETWFQHYCDECGVMAWGDTIGV